MQVKVHVGQNFGLVNDYLLQAAAQATDLQPVLVLVPDRYTLQAEQQMLRYRSPLLNTRVVTFSMLYRLVAGELNQGAVPLNVLDKTTAVLYLWSAIKQVQNDLVWFKKSAGYYDFAEKMFNTLNAIRSSCVPFADLEKQAKSTVAKKKYHDINLIYQKYQALINTETDSSGMLAYLIAHVRESTTLKQAKFFVCGFENLSPARLAVLHEICRYAAQVTIGAVVGEMANQLADYPHQSLTLDLPSATRLALQCETPRQEAIAVAERIVELINQGVNPEMITVLLADFTNLAPVWQVVFQQYQIPLNIDVGQKLSTTAEAKLVRDLLEMALNDNAENTIAVLFNQFSGVNDDTQRYALENQILQSNLRGRYLKAIPRLQHTQDLSALCAELVTYVQQEKLQQILTKIGAYAAHNPLTLRELANLFWTLCTATKISNIPLYRGRVLIAAVEEWVPTNVPYLFIANCTAENFPQGQADNDILQETDLAETRIVPTPSWQRWRNYQHALLLLQSATQMLCLSGINEDLTSLTAQFAFPQAPQLVVPVRRQIYQPKFPQDNLTQAAPLFFPTRTVRTTLLEKYYSCPYLNFIQNGLRLQPREIYQLKLNQVGSVIHKALEVYFQEHDLELAITTGLQQLNFACAPIEKNLAQEIRFIVQQLDASYRDSQFQMLAAEQPIQLPLPHGYQLVGRIDRIDAITTADKRKALFVLDYKTGHTAGNIAASIYLGNKLQLPVYAQALTKTGIIAGAGYLSLPSGFAEERKKLQIHGFIATDYRYGYSENLVSQRAQQFVAPQTLNKICQYAQQQVEKAVQKIIAGDIQAQAVEPAVCDYCPVQAFCPQAGQNCRGDGVKIKWKDFAEVKV